MHDRIVFEPMDYNQLNILEKKRAMESLIFLVEKRDGTIKPVHARMVAHKEHT